MKQGFIFAALLAAAALCSPARAGELAVVEAWARATPPGATVAAAYLTIDNGAGGADRLLGASSDAAGRVEVHESRREGEVMRMRKVEPLDIAAGERVVFAPGGLHVMLMDLKAPLRQGEKLPLVLRFEHAGAVQLEAEVLAGDATDPHAGHHHH
jgi:copper(I)-binding protein